MEVKTLPSPAPRRILTVKRRSENLKEHREGFESVNNSKGFLPEQDPLNWIERRIMEMTNKPSYEIVTFKKAIWLLFMDIRRAIGKSAMNRQFVYNRIAAAIGYENWEAAINHVENGWIKNLRYGKSEGEVILAVRKQGLSFLEDFKFDFPMNFKSTLRKLKQVSSDIKGIAIRNELFDMARRLGLKPTNEDRPDLKFRLVKQEDYYLLYARPWLREEANKIVVKKIIPHPATGFLDHVSDTWFVDGPLDELFEKYLNEGNDHEGQD